MAIACNNTVDRSDVVCQWVIECRQAWATAACGGVGVICGLLWSLACSCRGRCGREGAPGTAAGRAARAASCSPSTCRPAATRGAAPTRPPRPSTPRTAATASPPRRSPCTCSTASEIAHCAGRMLCINRITQLEAWQLSAFQLSLLSSLTTYGRVPLCDLQRTTVSLRHRRVMTHLRRKRRTSTHV